MLNVRTRVIQFGQRLYRNRVLFSLAVFVGVVFGGMDALIRSLMLIPGPAWLGDMLWDNCLWIRLVTIGVFFLSPFVLIPIAIHTLVNRVERMISFAMIVFLVVFDISAIVSGVSFEKFRDRRVVSIVAEMEPLTAAIERYLAENRKAPDSLRVLVPAYFELIPDTGMMGYQSINYRPRTEESKPMSCEVRIRVEVSDELIYRPDGRYVHDPTDSPPRVIGKWIFSRS